MADIQVRKIDAAVKKKLDSLAKEKGLSLSQLIRNILTDYALHPDIKNVDDKYEVLVSNIVSLYTEQQEVFKEQIEINNRLLRRLIAEKEGRV